jgi:hypothetical protein
MRRAANGKGFRAMTHLRLSSNPVRSLAGIAVVSVRGIRMRKPSRVETGRTGALWKDRRLRWTACWSLHGSPTESARRRGEEFWEET